MRFFIFGPRMFGGLFRPAVSLGGSQQNRAPEPGRSVQDFVYVIAGDHGLTKIGISNDPAARLASLQTGSPFHLRIAHVAPAGGHAFEIEQEAHAILADKRQSGEWFRVSPEIAIAAVYGASARTGYTLTGASETAASKPPMSRGAQILIWIAIIIWIAWGLGSFSP
jgi:hypothetical protein